MSGFALKILALAAMTLDHAAVALMADGPPPFYLIMRIVGGLAFPIYAFLLTEGYVHTRNKRAYMARMAALALLSEIPFDLAVFGTAFYPDYQNVFFTLLIGLLMLTVLQALPETGNRVFGIIGQGAAVLAAAYLSWLIRADYNGMGILMIFLLYVFRYDHRRRMTAGAVLALFIRPAGVFAFSVIHMYNGERGRQMKGLFYFYYPAHLLLLGMLRMQM